MSSPSTPGFSTGSAGAASTSAQATLPAAPSPPRWQARSIESRGSSSRAASANSGPNTSTFGATGSATSASSRQGLRQFSGTKIAPSLAQAKKRSSTSTPLCARIAARSPRPTPHARSQPATAFARRSRSR